MSYLFSPRKKQHGNSIAPVKFSVSEMFREMRIQGKRQDACNAGSNPRRWGKRGNSGRITLRACKRRNGFRKRTGGRGGVIKKARPLAGAGLKGCNDLIFQVVTFLYRIIGNEKVTVYFQLIARKCRISNNRLQNMKNFRDWQILFDRRKNGWINKPLQQQLKN